MGAGSVRVAVVGAGAFGGWTAWALARAGCEVVLVDAWGPGNARASSGGESRVLRASYGARRVFSELAVRSLALWRERERELGHALFRRTGLLGLACGADDAEERASVAVLRALGIAVEELSASDVARRFPAVSTEGVRWAYVEPDAGVLLARRACSAVRDAFVRAGGTYREARARLGPERGGRLARLELSDGTALEADRYVLACGPWLAELAPAAPLAVTRQEVFYFGLPAGDSAHRDLPVWFDHGERFWYGVPDTERRGFKLADDTPGPAFDPTDGDRTPTADGLARAREQLARRFPALSRAPLVEARVCQYASTPDHAFVLDRHPALADVLLVGGGSGHGFKHGPAVGELARDLALGRAEPDPRFALARFGARG